MWISRKKHDEMQIDRKRLDEMAQDIVIAYAQLRASAIALQQAYTLINALLSDNAELTRLAQKHSPEIIAEFHKWREKQISADCAGRC